jgi:NAD(P)-dependent dehydrogenase (short-subunit alcohol dehydrogenase family)
MSAARTAVVTGAASGIGLEVADRFLANGDTVAAADLSQETPGACRTRRDTDPTAPENPSLHT